MPGSFITPLELEYLDGHKWRITAPFTYHLGTKDGLEFVEIPIGFVTDFASVPKILWTILPPTGSYGKAAVVHDWLYQKRSVSVAVETGILSSTPDGKFTFFRNVDRAEADHILNEAMTVLQTDSFTRWMIYSGVRMGGWAPWDHYRAAERIGDYRP